MLNITASTLPRSRRSEVTTAEMAVANQSLLQESPPGGPVAWASRLRHYNDGANQQKAHLSQEEVIADSDEEL